MNPTNQLWQVAVDAPLPSALTYQIPQAFSNDPRLRRGHCVRVPLGRRAVSGVLLGPGEISGNYKVKEILDFTEERPVLPESFLRWLEWLAKYYVHPIGSVVESCFPPLPKAKAHARRSKKSPVVPELEADVPHDLTAEQRQVIGDIGNLGGQSGFHAHLVHGVTGSGKTEIYMRLLQEVIARGQQGLLLVPEISLTPQLIDRFSRRLGTAIAVIHSHLTPREKTNQWWAMLEGEKSILIGARSALFCPLPRLGMIVVDEEHESSFKQDEKLKYHARDAAVMLGKFSNCPVVLGSATPSLESWHNAQTGRYRLHQLKARVADRSLPQIEVIDMREVRDDRKTGKAGVSGDLPYWLSQPLFTALLETLEKGEQSALFLNRRGIAQAVVCPNCGFAPECPNCTVKLTLHGRSDLVCHYCDYHETLREHCTNCKEGEPKPLGLGTETLERDLRKLFPGARLARMDRDEISTREDLERVIGEVERREIDILIGTQMIAKGLDFPGLTLVGLVMADVAFNLPDFRASERSFQLLTQVSGRSGRHLNEGAGKVIVQTYNPDHPSITFTCAHDYEGFAKYELGFRQALSYPPYARLSSFRIQGPDLDKVVATAKQLRTYGETLKTKSERFATLELLGPAEAPLAKIRNNYRWQLLVKGPDSAALGSFCRALSESQAVAPPGVRILIDMDAVHLL